MNPCSTLEERWAALLNRENWKYAAFLASDFTGQRGDDVDRHAVVVQTIGYLLTGRTLTVAFDLRFTSVGGAVNTDLQLQNGQWGGFQCANPTVFGSPTITSAILVGDNAIVYAAGLAFIGGNNQMITFRNAAQANWTASATNTFVRGAITFESKR